MDLLCKTTNSTHQQLTHIPHCVLTMKREIIIQHTTQWCLMVEKILSLNGRIISTIIQHKYIEYKIRSLK